MTAPSTCLNRPQENMVLRFNKVHRFYTGAFVAPIWGINAHSLRILFAPFGRTIIYSGKPLLNKELRSWTVRTPTVKLKTSHVAPLTAIPHHVRTVALWTGTWT